MWQPSVHIHSDVAFLSFHVGFIYLGEKHRARNKEINYSGKVSAGKPNDVIRPCGEGTF